MSRAYKLIRKNTVVFYYEKDSPKLKRGRYVGRTCEDRFGQYNPWCYVFTGFGRKEAEIVPCHSIDLFDGHYTREFYRGKRRPAELSRRYLKREGRL